MYKYRINENDQAKAEKFQKGRIDAFSDIEKQLVDVVKTIRQAKIETIAAELAQPWIYGTALHRFARLHKVPIESIREINDAVDAAKSKFAPAEPMEIE